MQSFYQTWINIFLCIITFLHSPFALGWNAYGHRIVAEIAYQELTAETRQHINQYTNALNQLWGKYSFADSSVWADVIAGHDITAFDTWHYIALPYSPNQQLSVPESSHNVVWAIQQAQRVVQSNRSNTYEKALFLRFLVHFVADIHQPLHCIQLFNQRFPKGDKGGNGYIIKDKYARNLHELWDRGLGLLMKNRFTGKKSKSGALPITVESYAKELRHRYPKSLFKDQLEIKDFKRWADESYQIAVKYVYQQPIDERVSETYRTQGQAIVEKQLALAGYRLVQLLEQVH